MFCLLLVRLRRRVRHGLLYLGVQRGGSLGLRLLYRGLGYLLQTRRPESAASGCTPDIACYTPVVGPQGYSVLRLNGKLLLNSRGS